MRKISKAFVLGALIATMGGAGITAWAEMPGPGTQISQGQEHRDGRRDPAARLASLKSDLGIRPEQAASWDAYSKVVLDTVARMHAARGGVNRDAVKAMSPADRDAFMTKMHDQRTQARATVKAAAEALLPSLDEAQKAKAQAELPGLKAHERHHAALGTTGAPTGPMSR